MENSSSCVILFMPELFQVIHERGVAQGCREREEFIVAGRFPHALSSEARDRKENCRNIGLLRRIQMR